MSVAEESQLVEDAHSINVGDNLHVKYGRKKYPAILKAKGKSITILDNALALPLVM